MHKNAGVVFLKTQNQTKQNKNCFSDLQERMSLGLLRSDYLPHNVEDNFIKQVEINTIASSFGGISTQITPLHRYSKFNNLIVSQSKCVEKCTKMSFKKKI